MDEMRQKRIDALKEMLRQDETDVFALYGLALEYKAVASLDDALSLLRKVVQYDPQHLYAYYQLGEILHARGDDDDAQDILEQGLTEANRLGEPKAAHELQSLLDMI